MRGVSCSKVQWSATQGEAEGGERDVRLIPLINVLCAVFNVLAPCGEYPCDTRAFRGLVFAKWVSVREWRRERETRWAIIPGPQFAGHRHRARVTKWPQQPLGRGGGGRWCASVRAMKRREGYVRSRGGSVGGHEVPRCCGRLPRCARAKPPGNVQARSARRPAYGGGKASAHRGGHGGGYWIASYHERSFCRDDPQFSKIKPPARMLSTRVQRGLLFPAHLQVSECQMSTGATVKTCSS